jgi:hypothetical protein
LLFLAMKQTYKKEDTHVYKTWFNSNK